MEPLSDASNTPREDYGQLRKSGRYSSELKDRRRSLLTPGSTGTPNSERRNSARLHGRRLANDLDDSQARQRASQANLLDPEQVGALYHQCIKLATENKITSKNTWALGLIDHLHDLVQPSEQEGSTNFQRASVTLGAGVEIYAKRVDSVHTEAFKVLGGLSRGGGAAADDEAAGEAADESESGDGEADSGRATRKAAMLRDVNPSSTLEPSFESLNVKKFDLAFTVDPLFHKTSAQFDEGGARGLLLYNLSVCRGCEIVFDSQEAAEGGSLTDSAPDQDFQVDVAPLKNQISTAMGQEDLRLCPAIDDLNALLGKPAESEFEAEAARLVASVPWHEAIAESSAMETSEIEASDAHGLGDISGGEDDIGSFNGHFSDDEEDGADPANCAPDGEAEGNEGPIWMTQQPLESQAVEPEDDRDVSIGGLEASQNESRNQAESQAAGLHATQEQSTVDAVQWLVSGVENLSLEGQDWAGSSHWRYRTRQNPEGEPETAPAASKNARSSSKRKRGEPLDFNNLPELPEGALALADAKDITLKNWGSRAPTLLPEDLHYKASSLAELFLKPGRPIFESPASQQQEAGAELSGGYGGSGAGSYDDADDFALEHEDDAPEGGGGWADIEFGAAADLVEAPRKVAQIGINYARAAKQVDVRALKQSLWHVLGEVHDQQMGSSEEVSFQEALQRLSPSNVTDSISDLSVHLCFICVLHLANENGLRITGVPSLDQMTIAGVPRASTI